MRLAAAMNDDPDGKGSPPPPFPKGKGKGKKPSVFARERAVYGPTPVEDEDGLENVLVHIIGINGDWMWSGVVPAHFLMDQVQRVFQMSEPSRFGLVDGHWYKLVWEWAILPIPQWHPRAQGPPYGQVHQWGRMDLASVTGIIRSPDTQEVWVTAIKVLVI